MTDPRTHYPGCWSEHHDCAIQRVQELEAEEHELRQEVLELRAKVRRYEDTGAPGCDVCGNTLERNRMFPNYVKPCPCVQTVSGPVPCFPERWPVESAHGLPQESLPVAMKLPVAQRIPGSASWTLPAPDEPPTVADATHPHP